MHFLFVRVCMCVNVCLYMFVYTCKCTRAHIWRSEELSGVSSLYPIGCRDQAQVSSMALLHCFNSAAGGWTRVSLLPGKSSSSELQPQEHLKNKHRETKSSPWEACRLGHTEDVDTGFPVAISPARVLHALRFWMLLPEFSGSTGS